MKKILVPTDFSDCAKSAEDYGLDLAVRSNAEIHFLHIVTTPVEWTKLPLEQEKFFPETKAHIGHAKSELNALKMRAEKLGLTAEVFLSFDKARDEIINHTKENQIDFIVMGSHGASGANQILGSNTQKVVRYAPVPVIVIKEKPSGQPIKNIVFAASFEEDIHAPFQKVLAFAKLLRAEVHLLYVNVPYHFIESDETHAKMQAFLEKYPHESFSFNIYNALNEERGILKFSEAFEADVVAVATHGKSGFVKIFSPSIAERVVNASKIPVLSVSIHQAG